LKLSYGHARSRQVPALDGTDVRACRRCSLWFAARPRERVCDGCVPQKARNARFASDPHWGTKAALKRPRGAGQRAQKGRAADPGYVTESALLGVTFTRPIPVWLGLALEAAACLDGKRPEKAWKRDPLAPRGTGLKPVRTVPRTAGATHPPTSQQATHPQVAA
jgi:hypothetical protein